MPPRKTAAKAARPKKPPAEIEEPTGGEDRPDRSSLRQETREVHAYLTALEQHRPRRGRKPDQARAKAKIEDLKVQIAQVPPGVKQLALVQKMLDEQEKLETGEADDGFLEAEEKFVKHAGAYGKRKGISYQAWQQCGVPAEVLKKAGITRT